MYNENQLIANQVGDGNLSEITEDDDENMDEEEEEIENKEEA